MTLFLATKLTVEQCAELLDNAIDPIPSSKERLRSAKQTTWASNPLPGAGQRTAGFGYAPGTRPVVGTITDGQFHLEKRVVQASFGNSTSALPAITASCTGHLSATMHGALIEIDMERPVSGQAFLIMVGLFMTIAGLLVISLLISYVSGSYVSATPTDVGSRLGPCIVVLLFIVPLTMFATGAQSGRVEREYLLRFVKQVCKATPLEDPPADVGSAYTGKTQHLS